MSMSRKIGWFGIPHPCDEELEECPSGISRLAARTSPQIPAGEAEGDWDRPTKSFFVLLFFIFSQNDDYDYIAFSNPHIPEGEAGRGLGQTFKKIFLFCFFRVT